MKPSFKPSRLAALLFGFSGLFGGSVYAADFSVTAPVGNGFVVKNSGAVERLRVQEFGIFPSQ